MSKLGGGWGKFFVVPIETGRGCPYGCEFCTVTGFFGDSIRFRTNESVVEELLRLKERAKKEKGQIAVFFIDDNLAINKKRLKSLLRDMIAAGATLPWVAQISANLLADEELVDLIAEAGRTLDLYRHGIDRPGEHGRRQQEFLETRKLSGGARRAREDEIFTRSLHSFLEWTTTPRASRTVPLTRSKAGRPACRFSAS